MEFYKIFLFEQKVQLKKKGNNIVTIGKKKKEIIKIKIITNGLKTGG